MKDIILNTAKKVLPDLSQLEYTHSIS